MKRFLLLASVVVMLSAFAFCAEPGRKVYESWPFDSTEAAKRQAETAKTIGDDIALKIPLPDAKGATLNFRLIPAGKFEMGSPKDEPGHEGDEPLHEEMIADPFYMMETQLTVEAYRALMHADPPGTAADADPALPAGIEYRDAVDHVMPSIAKITPKGWKVILPNRARLEYASRAGVATMNPGGNRPADADAYAWTQENSGGKLHPVAQKKPNAWGLYDVLGNRWTWYWVGDGREGNADNSHENHIVYGGTYKTPASGNGARLANIMVSRSPEGVRFALLREETPLPKGHPDFRNQQRSNNGGNTTSAFHNLSG